MSLGPAASMFQAQSQRYALKTMGTSHYSKPLAICLRDTYRSVSFLAFPSASSPLFFLLATDAPLS